MKRYRFAGSLKDRLINHSGELIANRQLPQRYSSYFNFFEVNVESFSPQYPFVRSILGRYSPSASEFQSDKAFNRSLETLQNAQLDRLFRTSVGYKNVGDSDREAVRDLEDGEDEDLEDGEDEDLEDGEGEDLEEVEADASNADTADLHKYFIYQADIDAGTLILDRPGHYVVMEDLVFNPNSVGTQVFGIDAQRLGLKDGERLDPYRSGNPLPSQFSMAGGPYDPKAYGIGFFAMISVIGEASGSILDLNGFKIQQSEEHALQQRFFSVIELAGAPFITGQGPHDFGPDGNNAVSDFTIMNGTIGLSSHHGVHGNGNNNIVIQDVDFENYEVAAVALNGVDGLTVKDVNAINRTDVPVLGSYSNARFISSYIDYLAGLDVRHPDNSPVSSLNVNGQSLSAESIQVALKNSINNVFDDIIASGDGMIDSIDSNYYLYNNPSGFVDGNSYGFLTGPVGVQVNGFPATPEGGFQTPSSNVVFENVSINGQHSFVTEVPVLSNNLDGGMSDPVVDPIGAAFMLRNKTNGLYNTLETEEGALLRADASVQDVLAANYKSNVLSDAQLLVAKNQHLFVNSPLDVSRMTIGADVVSWAESDAPLSVLRNSLNLEDGWIYNVDNMLHVQKGTIGYKLDGVTGLLVEDTSVENIVATGEFGFDGQYEVGSINDTSSGYGGADAYGFTFSASTNVLVSDASAENVNSQNGEAFGFASPLDNTTDISFVDAEVYGLTSYTSESNASNMSGQSYEFFNV